MEPSRRQAKKAKADGGGSTQAASVPSAARNVLAEIKARRKQQQAPHSAAPEQETHQGSGEARGARLSDDQAVVDAGVRPHAAPAEQPASADDADLLALLEADHAAGAFQSAVLVVDICDRI